MDTNPTDNASTATVAAPPITLKHDASSAIYMTACNPSNEFSHNQVTTLATAIALLEQTRGNVPAFVDPDAEKWLRAMAAAVVVPGQFKAESKKMKYDRHDDMPKGVSLIGGVFTIDGANSQTAQRQLLRMADRCTGTDEGANFSVLVTRIERSIRAERKAGA